MRNHSPPQPPRNQSPQPIINHSPPTMRNHSSPEAPMRRRIASNEPIRKQQSPVAAALSLLHNDLAEEVTTSTAINLRRGRTEDVIPCDLCGTCMPASTFLQHQV